MAWDRRLHEKAVAPAPIAPGRWLAAAGVAVRVGVLVFLLLASGRVPPMQGLNIWAISAVPLLTFFLSPLMAGMSRSHEFEADAYAMAQTNGADLASALLKLFKDNASTLTPDPVYARFYYSHPPASERLARLLAASPTHTTTPA